MVDERFTRESILEIIEIARDIALDNNISFRKKAAEKFKDTASIFACENAAFALNFAGTIIQQYQHVNKEEHPDITFDEFKKSAMHFFDLAFTIMEKGKDDLSKAGIHI